MVPAERIAKQLEKTGLGSKAALIYACLLESGGAYPSQLSEVTRINRSTVYKVLTELSIKGLANEIEKGKKLYYQATNPRQLLRYTQLQVQHASEMKSRAHEIFPEINQLYSALPHKPKFLYFEGPTEIMRVYDDHIAIRKPYEMLCFASSTEIYDFLTPHYFTKYRKAKERFGITTRGILPDRPLDRAWSGKLYGDVSKSVQPTARFIPPGEFPFQGEITMYGDSKVSIINLDKKNITAIVVEDISFHRAMRGVFELAWKGVAH